MANATEVSAFCSIAYKVLQDDISRAKYILEEEHGIKALEEMVRETDHELMMWVFSTRMEIEDADSQQELAAMLMQIQSDYDAKIDLIASLFEQNNFEKVKGELDQTQYLK